MPTLAQDLRAMITELDNAQCNDEAYRHMFSTFVKQNLRSSQTWRQRLLEWCQREEDRDAQDNEQVRIQHYVNALEHWQTVGYSYESARALAAVKWGQDADVRQWAKNYMTTMTNQRLEDML